MHSLEPVERGVWDENTSWEMYESDTIEHPELCTAVACVALTGVSLDKVVLTRNRRGWEILAGHIESGESLDDTLRRESLEEGGFDVSDAHVFGYRKITSTIRPAPDSRSASYPYPESYIAYFVAKSNSPIQEPTGDEIIASSNFTLDEVENLVRRGKLTRMEYIIINLGLKAARNIWGE